MGSLAPQPAELLAATAGLGSVRSLTPIAGGANNRVFRMVAANGVALLKAYFRHPDDPRDRLGAEFAFSRFAWESGVRSIPQPLACDPVAGLGLFEFVEGRPLKPSEVSADAVDQALDFFRTLNRARQHPTAATLPHASESCPTLDDHFGTVARRIERLKQITVSNSVDGAAAAFVESELAPTWTRLLAEAHTTAASLGMNTDTPLQPVDRCLSPSDFGYHNALRTANGPLRFLDFEYAGWDDPGKLVCDFFCQPAIPAPLAAFDRFVHAVAAEFPHPELVVARSVLLLPIYRVKWVCIMLNEFLPVGGSRRAFSGTAAELESRKISQLAKARHAAAALMLPDNTPRKVA